MSRRLSEAERRASSDFYRPLDQLSAAEIARGLDARRAGHSWWALCPAHDDHNPSLKIDQARDGTVLVKCWAGCDQAAVVAALRSRGLWHQSPRISHWQQPPRRQPIGPDNSERSRIALALGIWREARA